MSSSELPRLCYNESDPVVAISEQILVAKEETRTSVALTMRSSAKIGFTEA